MTRVVVHIDRLVLRGVDRADGATISAAIETQLRQSLALPGVAQSLGEIGNRHQLNAGVVDASGVGGARQLGRRVGKRIAKGVTA